MDNICPCGEINNHDIEVPKRNSNNNIESNNKTINKSFNSILKPINKEKFSFPSLIENSKNKEKELIIREQKINQRENYFNIEKEKEMKNIAAEKKNIEL